MVVCVCVCVCVGVRLCVCVCVCVYVCVCVCVCVERVRENNIGRLMNNWRTLSAAVRSPRMFMLLCSVACKYWVV
jgi:hypothetical protein